MVSKVEEVSVFMRMSEMIDYREGAKCTAVCGYCNKSVPATLTKVTLSLCEGIEEVKGVLVDTCDECGNMIAIPACSLPPIRLAHKKLVESGKVSKGAITTELKSIVDARNTAKRNTERNSPQVYPLVAAAG